MGLTPLQGLVMGTRTGDIDPAGVFHLSRVANMSIDAIDDLLNKKSGVLGMCGVSDMRDLHALVDSGDENAILAQEVYVHRLVHYVGAYAALLGGIDALVFTAGIGENDDVIRELLCDRLGLFGVKLDKASNSERSGDVRIISTPDSNIKIVICPTNEELAIAQEVVRLAK
jgi:acetate kinase